MLWSRCTNTYLEKSFNNKRNSLSCKSCDKIQFEASAIPPLLYSVPSVSDVFPSRPKIQKRDFETCNSKSCSVATKLFYNANILKVIPLYLNNPGTISKSHNIPFFPEECRIWSFYHLKFAQKLHSIHSPWGFMPYLWRQMWHMESVCHINTWRTSLKTLLFLLYHLTHFIRLFTLL